MRWWWLALALVLGGACNRVFGLASTELIDAPPPDAPPMCSGSAPQFSPSVHQVVFQPCIDYTISRSANRALAMCTDNGGQDYYFADGEIDAPLHRAVGFDGLTFLDGAVLEPDGNAAMVFAFDGVSTAWRRYLRAPAGTWSLAATYTLAAMPITTPTAGATPHILGRPDALFHEYAANGTGGWTEIATYTNSELGVSANASHPTWTTDGLQLLMYDQIANNQFSIAYTQRASLADRFGKVTYLSSIAAYAGNDTVARAPYGVVGYMTDDCGRFYFAALSSVFYVQQ